MTGLACSGDVTLLGLPGVDEKTTASWEICKSAKEKEFFYIEKFSLCFYYSMGYLSCQFYF